MDVEPAEETLDYRDLLREAYAARKADNPLYSYRLMARKLNLNVSHLYRILQKELHLALDRIPTACELLGLEGRKAEHFELLVRYGRSRSERTRAALLERILALRDPPRRRLSAVETRVLSRWQAPVVRSLALSGETRPECIGKRMDPPQQEGKVRALLADLEQCGLLVPDGKDGWQAGDLHLTASTAARSEAVHRYQAEVLGLAATALGRIPREHRDISTLVVSIDEEARQEIVEMVRECRRQIVRRVERCEHPDRVLQLAFAAFPVASPEVET